MIKASRREYFRRTLGKLRAERKRREEAYEKTVLRLKELGRKRKGFK